MNDSTWLRNTLKNLQLDRDKTESLAGLLASKTARGADGFAIFTGEGFERFKSIPHLFRDGLRLSEIVRGVEAAVEEELAPAERAPILAVTKLLSTLVNTANITAPSDLWLLKHVLSSYAHLGFLSELGSGRESAAEFASARGLDARIVDLDTRLLLNRGFLRSERGKLAWVDSPQVATILKEFQPLPDKWPSHWVPKLRALFGDPNTPALTAEDRALLDEWLALAESSSARESWPATLGEIELGYRVLTIVLAIRTTENYRKMLAEKRLIGLEMGANGEGVKRLLVLAGLAGSSGEMTELGLRVLERGPGPFGITHAYYPYMEKHLEQLQGREVNRWINRAHNIAASQDANARAFAKALESLERFRKTTGFKYSVFIEHAVGQGEATRQHFLKHGEERIQYFGADLEEKAIEQTRRQQSLGNLPKNMKFVSGADIGKPRILIDAIEKAGFSTQGSVMIVGNGFHEVRGQTDAMMAEVFRGYREAGILLIFSEETFLTDAQVLNSAWNTYHAGFRYLHDLSGQGLRTFSQKGVAPRELSWKACAEAGGYKVFLEYTSRGRSILPAEPSDENPAITVNYFCVP